MKTFYVYAHFIPNSDTPFYVGKGTGRRYKKTDNRNKWWRYIVAKYGYESRILSESLSENEACELEKKLIAQYGRRDLGTGVLVNMTDGGESSKGSVLTEEQRAAVSARSKKMWASFSDEKKQQIRLKQRAWNESLSDEERKKLSEKIGKASKGRVHNEESRKLNSEAQKQYWENASEEVKDHFKKVGKEASKKYWKTITAEQLEAHSKRSRETALKRWKKYREEKDGPVTDLCAGRQQGSSRNTQASLSAGS